MANKTFGVFKLQTDAGEYINNKKSQRLYNSLKKNSNIKFENESDLLSFNSYKNNNKNIVDKTNLNINLITTIDLSSVPVIMNNTGNVIPSTITSSFTPIIQYTIDPCGNLFGKNKCGINNYKNINNILQNK